MNLLLRFGKVGIELIGDGNADAIKDVKVSDLANVASRRRQTADGEEIDYGEGSQIERIQKQNMLMLDHSIPHAEMPNGVNYNVFVADLDGANTVNLT